MSKKDSLLVYVAGFVGNLGTKYLIERKKDILLSRFSENYLEESFTLLEDGINPSLFSFCSIVDSEDIGRGGLLSALWKICERNNWGLKYSLRDVPIYQCTIEVANFFDINPYRLSTYNAKIIVTDAFIQAEKRYIVNGMNGVSCIGTITNDKKRIRIDSEVESFLTKDYKDEIDNIIPNFSKKYNAKL